MIFKTSVLEFYDTYNDTKRKKARTNIDINVWQLLLIHLIFSYRHSQFTNVIVINVFHG